MRAPGQESLVVVGVDGSEGSRAALRYAVRLAQASGAPIRLVHVIPEYVPPPPLRPSIPPHLRVIGRAVLSRAEHLVRTAYAGGEVSTRLLTGSRADALVRLSGDAGLVVLGHQTGTRPWTGRTVTGVVDAADCPVVTVPAGWQSGRSQGPVVVALKTPDHALELLSPAFAEASRADSELVVLHVRHLPGLYDELAEVRTHDGAWQAHLDTMLDPLVEAAAVDHPEVDHRVEVVHDQPARALLAASTQATLFVLARRTRANTALLGSTARAVLREATCPVMVLPTNAGLSLPSVHGLELEESGTGPGAAGSASTTR